MINGTLIKANKIVKERFSESTCPIDEKLVSIDLRKVIRMLKT